MSPRCPASEIRLRPAIPLLGAVALAAVTIACAGGEPARSAGAPTPSATAPPTAPVTSGAATTRAGAGRVTLRGSATLDGAPFDSRFLGVEVRDHGLSTSCQAEIPPVDKGRYEVPVYSEREGDGCGRPGAELVLWTYVNEQRVFSTTAAPWPADGSTATFDARFSMATPNGAHAAATELAGEAFDREDRLMPAGSRVEAFVGDQLCAVGTIRANGDFQGFSMGVVGPDSIPGCARDGMITFKVAGRRAVETLKNDGSLHRSFDLTVE